MERVIEIALAEIGTVEEPKDSNCTKYGAWFGWDGVPWCGIFVSWCYAKAGLKLPRMGFIKGFAGCQTAVAYCKKHGLITKKPKPGDIGFFDWNGDGRYDHTFIFMADLGNGRFASIEGNTSQTNQSNGGQVMKRVRLYSSAIFAHFPQKDNEN